MDDQELNHIFSNMILQKRHALGLTQKEVANVVGCSQITILRYEKEDYVRFPDDETARKLFDLFKLPYETIGDLEHSLGGEGHERPSRRGRKLPEDTTEKCIYLLDRGWYHHEIAESLDIHKRTVGKIAKANDRGRETIDHHALGFRTRSEYSRWKRQEYADRFLNQVFAELITEGLMKTDLTLDELGKRIGIDGSLLSYYSRGERLPGSDEVAAAVFAEFDIPYSSIGELKAALVEDVTED